jgi:hypothetical protein
MWKWPNWRESVNLMESENGMHLVKVVESVMPIDLVNAAALVNEIQSWNLMVFVRLGDLLNLTLLESVIELVNGSERVIVTDLVSELVKES